MYLALFRMLTVVGVASLLAACSASSGSAPTPQTPGSLTPSSASQAAASASRGALEHSKKNPLAATPASLSFASGDTAPKTVTVSGGSGGSFDVSIAGTGNCPAVSPAKLNVKRHDEDGDRDRDHHDASSGIITVTPAGAGPAACVITLISRDHDDGDEHGDRDHHDGDRHGDRHDGDHHGTPAPAPALTIPVTVAAPVATPTPIATPTPVPTCGARGGC